MSVLRKGLEFPRGLAAVWANRMTRALEEAKAVAHVEVVGSIRRSRPYVSDIELLARPHMDTGDLFGGEHGAPILEPILEVLAQFGSLEKSGARYMKLALAPSEGVTGPNGSPVDRYPSLDLFLCHPPASWGVLRAIRTGPAQLGRLAVTRIRARGWRCKRGAIWLPVERDPRRPPHEGPAHAAEVEFPGEPGKWRRLHTPDEPAFFAAARIPCLPPDRRDRQAAQLLDDERRRRA